MSAAEHQDATVADPGLRRIWLCADDYGISPSVDRAIRDLIMRGRLNATSVMVVAPSLRRSEAISLGILNSGRKRVAIGLHVHWAIGACIAATEAAIVFDIVTIAARPKIAPGEEIS